MAVDTRDKRNPNGGELARGILLAHLILIFHIGLIALLGFVILLLGGLARHLAWFLIGGAAVVLASAYFVYQRLKRNSGKLFETIHRLPHLRDREIEIRLLGGIMSLKFNRSHRVSNALPTGEDHQQRQLEDPATVRNRELMELAVLVEKNLISREEFNQIKQEVLNSK